MDREKQIEEASVEYQIQKRPMAIGGDAFGDMVYRMNINPSFVAGATWSDEHPKKGLINIDDVCEWIDEHIWDYIKTRCLSDFEILDEVKFAQLIEDLKGNFKHE